LEIWLHNNIQDDIYFLRIFEDFPETTISNKIMIIIYSKRKNVVKIKIK